MAEAQAQEVMETCSICVESFNRTMRKKVTCENCHTDICTKCIKRFLAETLQEPNCMQCRELYTTSFLDNSFSINYRRQVLKNIRETILVEREKQHLPELMHRADALRKSAELNHKCRLLCTEAYELRSQLNRWDTYINDLQESIGVSTDEALIQKATETLAVSIQTRAQMKQKLKDIKRAEQELHNQRAEYETLYLRGGVMKVDQVVSCIQEGCKGFLDNNYVCGLCDTHVCSECREVKEDGHVCIQANIDSVKAIVETTKPCPTCNTRIYKIEGCDQMFCMHCHTAFSWDTGMIERGRIHNPHYFEWMRKQRTIMPREVGDVPCGGLPMLFQIQDQLDTLQVSIAEYVYIGAIHKMAEYIQEKEMRRYPVTLGRDEELNLASIQYLAESITERQWRSKLAQLEKRREINTEKRLIIDMLLAVLTDYFRGLFDFTQKEQVTSMLSEVEEMRIYYNGCIDNLRLRFDSYNFKKISKDWSKLIY